MAVDGLNLRGTGVIYDTRGSVNQYLKQAQQNQARQQAEQKALADDMAKIKIDGVRQPDVPEYTSKYNEWKGLYGDIQKEKSLEKKAALKRQFDEKELELQELVQDSKTLGKGEQALNAIFLDPSKRENFADDAVTRYQQSKTLSRKDPRYIRDLTAFERKVDVNKVLSDLEKDDAVVLKSSKWNNPVEVKHRQGNKDGVLVTQERVIDPNMQAERYDAKWNADNDFKVALKQLYPDIAAQVQDPIQQKQALITQLVNDRIKREPAKPVFKENEKPDNFYAHQAWLRAHPMPTKNSSAEDSELYRVKWVNDMMDGVSGSGEQLKSIVAARGEYDSPLVIGSGGKDVVKIKVPNKNVMSLDANGEVKMKIIPARVLTFDKKNPDDKVKLNALVSELTKENVSVSKFKTGNSGGKIKKPQDKKTISRADLASKADASGYSIGEYEKLLKSKGVKIQ